jgi:probable addiction module antidote protein
MTINITSFDPAVLLHNDEDIKQAINTALSDSDPRILVLVLKDIAKIKGMTELAQKTGLNRENLYRILSGKTKPRWETVHKVLNAFDVKLKVA